ncbi:hypothetical protein DFH07DRAFT_779063 [Mycena maculata]|uniref:Uncharacterized protein n=1 Tax=Mycena maculata TaxID=230809 RepID=A0AAD7MYZ8_9AGAR|nr:hypothetical protein DFH07DRAFT_779063 [Mycena maculata]
MPQSDVMDEILTVGMFARDTCPTGTRDPGDDHNWIVRLWKPARMTSTVTSFLLRTRIPDRGDKEKGRFQEVGNRHGMPEAISQEARGTRWIELFFGSNLAVIIFGSLRATCERTVGTDYAGIKRAQTSQDTPDIPPEVILRVFHELPQAIAGRRTESGRELEELRSIGGTDFGANAEEPGGAGDYAGEYCGASPFMMAGSDRIAGGH